MVETKPKRPWTVSLAQIVLVGIALFYLSIPVRYVLSVRETLGYYGVSIFDSPGTLVTQTVTLLSTVLPFAIATLLALWGLARRNRLGRWLSIAVFFFGSLLSASLFFIEADGGFGIDPTPAYVEGVGNRIVLLVLPSIFIFLMFCLGGGQREKEFFQWRPQLPVSEPPPPPNFDS